VEQYTALVSFEKVYAPFDGVVTARNTDVGDLINSGSSGGVKTDLFHIAQPGKLRVYVNVPEEYSRGVKVGMTADLSLAEFPGRRFRGKLVRTADAITVTTRTLLVESMWTILLARCSPVLMQKSTWLSRRKAPPCCFPSILCYSAPRVYVWAL